jgi:hypothetical protein
MAISASGYYGLTLESQLVDGLGASLETAASWYHMLVTDGYTHDYDTHADRADVTNEVTAGSGYTAGGKVATTLVLTPATPTNGDLKFDDTTDPAWATSTITDAMAMITYHTTGVAANDELLMLSDFGTAVSTSNGTLTVQIAANGLCYFSYAA